MVDRFLDALERELSWLIQPREVDTLFLGGGTPTFLSERQLERLLELCHTWLPLAVGGEFSCEANPRDCTPEKLNRLRIYGIHRLSIGGQSFNDEKLKVLERDHTGVELSDVVKQAMQVFPHVSLDFNFLLPPEKRWISGGATWPWRSTTASLMYRPMV